MTRAHVERPVWSWRCDQCCQRGFELAYTASALPSADEMRERGWFIADKWGDLCPACVEASKGFGS